MFQYFQGNYPWNLVTNLAINKGAAMAEVEEACRPLKEAAVANDVLAQEAWHESWKKLAERIEGLARDNEQARQNRSAGRKYLRSAIYFLMAERMIKPRDPRRVHTYRQGLAAFRKGAQLLREPVEWVEIPFRGKSMPALFSKAPGEGRGPCIVHLDGFDIMKEIIYLKAGEEFRHRGISLLIVDHPGVGEALRLREMYGGPNTEAPATACVDYLETRSDVDAGRIGIGGISLGGYYAPRAAAFEKRLKCCFAWGALWDFGQVVENLLSGRGGEPSSPSVANQAMWVFGKNTVEEAVGAAKELTLAGVTEKITCPLLVVHGENDRQIPLWHAEKTYETAVNSPNRRLKVFTFAEGGAEHCQVDNNSMAEDYIADWVAEVLGGNPQGI